MTARELEAALLSRCAAVARDVAPPAQDQREANVFQLAAAVVRSRYPRESTSLMQASNFMDAENMPASPIFHTSTVLAEGLRALFRPPTTTRPLRAARKLP